MQKKILLIEDDIEISEMVAKYLMKDGFSISAAFDGEQGVKSFLKEDFDLILLDIMLPKLNGMEVMKIIREKSLIPILIMSAKDSDADKAVGLGLGADDYISKPFSMLELTARVNAAIRRATQYSVKKDLEEKKAIRIGELEIFLDSFSVERNGVEIKLTSKEFEILKLFVTNPKRVFTKAQLYSLIWGEDYFGDENVINVHMSRLREKIEEDPSNPRYIKTLWGIGYKLGEF